MGQSDTLVRRVPLGSHRRDHEQHFLGDALPARFVQASADAGEDVQVDLADVSQ
jgi:hypothetical protein